MVYILVMSLLTMRSVCELSQLRDPHFASITMKPMKTKLTRRRTRWICNLVAPSSTDVDVFVSAPFDHLQFERETDFLHLAAKHAIPVVRCGTVCWARAARQPTLARITVSSTSRSSKVSRW